MKAKGFGFIFGMLLVVSTAMAASDSYQIDSKGAHAAIEFRIKHLGFSWLLGRFNRFTGDFRYDEKNPTAASFQVKVQTASIDSNHAERDHHLRGENFLEADKFPEATFVSTSFTPKNGGGAVLKGDLTLHGVTKAITIDALEVGAGKDPWGGFRRGFVGETTLILADFGIDQAGKLGPAAKEVNLFLSIEGILQ